MINGIGNRKEFQETLRIAMEKEICMLRELLSNMTQEENSLVQKDKDLWNRIMQERALMIGKLSSLRSDRIEATKKLEALAFALYKEKTISIEKILPATEEDSCTILTMRDQIMALLERLNRQNSHNQNLFQQHEQQLGLSNGRLQMEPPPSTKPFKTSVATYPRNR